MSILDKNNLSVFVFPMIDRDEEWRIIFEYLEQVLHQCCHDISCIFVTGPTGIGRSRLLAHINEELMYDSQSIRRVAYSASFEHAASFGFALKEIFKKLLYTELHEGDGLLSVLKSLIPSSNERHVFFSSIRKICSIRRLREILLLVATVLRQVEHRTRENGRNTKEKNARRHHPRIDS